MTKGLQLTTLRLSPRAQDVLRAIADDCASNPGRIASELMELALTGHARPTNARLTRPIAGAASSEAMARVLVQQQTMVLTSLRAAVAAKSRRAE